MALFISDFPDSPIGVLPVVTYNSDNTSGNSPQFLTVLQRYIKQVKLLVNNIHENAINIVLFLFVGSISYAHRRTVGISGEVSQNSFLQVFLPVDAVHDLYFLILVGNHIDNEIHKTGCTSPVA